MEAAGPGAGKRFYEFFTVFIRNRNTRQAYFHAAITFLDWCVEEIKRLFDSFDTSHPHAIVPENHTLAQVCARVPHLLKSWYTA